MRGLLGLVLVLFTAVAVAGPTTHEYKLDNGLKLIVKEDHRAPVMVSQVWYKVGSSYEHNGITGISHVLEHMMFKGTGKYPAGTFSRIIAENGGEDNAFTGPDYTAYFQTMEASRLPVSFELEADRMRNLTLPREEFLKEVQVVMEERRMRTEDNPQALAYERFKAAAYITNPYRNPVIGWMSDLEQLKIDDLERWYAQWYAPNNATLVVVGDVDPEQVLALAKEHFGPLKPGKIEAAKDQPELAQRGIKRLEVHAPAELPYLMMGYKVPVVLTANPGADWEPYALEVLAGVLDGGTSARLESEVVRGDAVATSAGAGYDAYDRLQSLFMLSGTPAKKHTIEDLEAEFRKQLRRLREERVPNDELARVKAQLRAAKVYEEDSIFYQAMQIGSMETIGLSWKETERFYERLDAITAEQVQAVARKYFSDTGLTVAELVPQPIDPANPPATAGANAQPH